MSEIMKRIITNVLTAFYQPFGFSILLSILLMFLYLYAKEHGWKAVLHKWLKEFKMNTDFRRLFFLTFYTAMILFRTLLNRNMWANPLSNVMGSWGLYNGKGELTTEAIENLMLFIPFAILLPWTMRDKVAGFRLKDMLWLSVKTVFLFSLTIEFLQLLLRLGTFQLSDLFYNTLGGFFGGLIYWIGSWIKGKGRKKGNGSETE